MHPYIALRPTAPIVNPLLNKIVYIVKNALKGLNMQLTPIALTARQPPAVQFNLGMSLIELMLVVTIVGILAMVVVPSFQEQILRARRGDGINHLLQLKIKQEAYRIEHINYASTLQLPLPISDFYTFSVSNVSATTYVLNASAIGSQIADSTCLSMSIDQSMNKTPPHCWK